MTTVSMPLWNADAPLANTASAVRAVQDHVMSLQKQAEGRASQMQRQAQASIQQILGLMPQFTLPSGQPPKFELNPFQGTNIHLPDLGSAAFGTISPITQSAFSLGVIPQVQRLQVQAFMPAFDQLALPPAPAPLNVGAAPVKPVLDAVTLPPAPALQRPAAPQLLDIRVPDFQFPALPEFNAQAPQFHAPAISAVLNWQERPYRLEILDEQMDKLRAMWNGQLGLPPAVEQALWERAAGREDVAAQREVAQAMQEFSSRGYTLPPGALLARVDDVRQQAGLRKIGLGREVMIKAADVQVENLRFACAQAIAAEQVLVSIWNSQAERAFQAARAQLDGELALLNAQIAVFNARQSAYATEANVYKARLEGALARVQVYKAQVEAALAKGQINEQAVRLFEAMQRAMLADVEVYKARMDGARVAQEVQKGRIEMFRAEVQAWAEGLQAQKLRFDAYRTQVEGEKAKADMLDSQAKAYASYVQGQSAIMESDIKNQQAVIEKERLRLQAWQGELEQNRTIMQQQVAVVQANAEAHKANTARMVASAQAQTSLAQANISAHEAQMRTSVAAFEANMRAYIVQQENMVRLTQLQVEALKAVAQMQSTMAAGAMAGINISSSITGGASYSGSLQSSDSLNRNFNYGGVI